MLQGSGTKGPAMECLYWSFPWSCQLLRGILCESICFLYLSYW